MRTAIVLLLTIVPSNTASAQDASLTGSYSGTVACERTADGRPGTFLLDLDIRIVQDGQKLSMATWTAEAVAAGERAASLYQGEAREAEGMISGYLTSCDPDFPYQEIVRIKPASAAEDVFSFAADTIFITGQLPGREGVLMTESCRWVMIRSSDVKPEMPVCPTK